MENAVVIPWTARALTSAGSTPSESKVRASSSGPSPSSSSVRARPDCSAVVVIWGSVASHLLGDGRGPAIGMRGIHGYRRARLGPAIGSTAADPTNRMRKTPVDGHGALPQPTVYL